jgi:fatty acid desaturase
VPYDWLTIAFWAVGALAIIYSFALGVGARRFGIAIPLFVVGLVLIIGTTVAGNIRLSHLHGMRPDEAPEITRPGGT